VVKRVRRIICDIDDPSIHRASECQLEGVCNISLVSEAEGLI